LLPASRQAASPLASHIIRGGFTPLRPARARPSLSLAAAHRQKGIVVQIDQALADTMIEQAMRECAAAHFAGDMRRTRLALLRGRCEHCRCIRLSLARQIGALLGEMASAVKAVFLYEALGEGEEEERLAVERQRGIRLLVWVERKSPALRALAETLETVLAAGQRKLGCPNATDDCFTLSMEFIDDGDVRARRGFGLLVESPTLHSQQVWSREVPPPPAAPEPEHAALRERFALPETLDPELIPEGRLIEHALSIERLPAQDRRVLQHHLTELKVTLIRRIISDRLEYINIAKQWLSVADIAEIHQRRIGFGRIGGKAAGMLLARSILQQVASPEVKNCLSVPESFFLGSDLMYIFMAMNGLMHWNDEKYRSEEQIRDEYPQIQQDFLGGELPPEILEECRILLEKAGPLPLIVRSSSQLEDSLGTSFAGKYDSHFCPNQGTPEENLRALTRAITMTYASTFKPDALLYRRSKGLQDYDERMAVLIQLVQGEQWEHYFFPFAAGVAFSQNPYRWSPRIRRQDGYARLVWGLGTRAVERVGNDYPRLVALSHPTLQPDDSPQAVRYYSQRYVDLIDLQTNSLETRQIHETLTPRYPHIRNLVQLERDGYFATPHSRILSSDIPHVAITFSELLGRSAFPALLTELLNHLEQHWHSPVDIEFTLNLGNGSGEGPALRLSLLQCRPLPSLQVSRLAHLPKDLAEDDIIFASDFMVPPGYLTGIRHVLFVPPEAYFSLPAAGRSEVGRAIGRLNAKLGQKSFICVGPGRWGTENFDLGILVGYADIFNAGALVEVSGKQVGPAPEPSFGTHFFHDLMEAQIYPIAIDLDKQGTLFNRPFFYEAPNCVQEYMEVNPALRPALRLIEVAAFRSGHHLELIMDDEKARSVAFLASDSA
jgi:hypothetical protein